MSTRVMVKSEHEACEAVELPTPTLNDQPFHRGANPYRITDAMERAAEALYAGKGVSYLDSLEAFMKEIES